MALQQLLFTFNSPENPATLPEDWTHSGVVGSGDMEVLLSRKELGGKVEAKVVTPVNGFDDIWEKVLQRFVDEAGLGNLSIEINDNNATPYIVMTRLRQALLEAKEGGEE